MMLRKFFVFSILLVLGIACAGAVMALYTDVSARASAPRLPDALSNIPSAYQFVFGVNVQRVVQSPAYLKLRKTNELGSEMTAFAEKTGLDPSRDITYVVGAGGSKDKTGGEGVAVVVGRFDKDAISRYIRTKSTPIEKEYKGSTVLMVPNPQNPDSIQDGIAFLGEHEIVLGSLESIKAVLDVHRQEGKSILANNTMMALIEEIGSEEMFWFAGDSTDVLQKAPVATQLTKDLPPIKNVVGKLNFGEAVTGRIAATALNEDSAAKLADTIRGLIAFGQLAGSQNPELRSLLGGLIVSQDSSRVSLALNVPVDLLEKVGKARALRKQ
jgi:hypothetical protein